MSESTGAHTGNIATVGGTKFATCGRPVAGVELKVAVVDGATKGGLPEGEVRRAQRDSSRKRLGGRAPCRCACAGATSSWATSRTRPPRARRSTQRAGCTGEAQCGRLLPSLVQVLHAEATAAAATSAPSTRTAFSVSPAS